MENYQHLRDFIIPHFVKYPLKTHKRIHFELFHEFIEEYAHVKDKKKYLIEKIDLLYNMNQEGKRRNLEKEEFIKRINEMKV